MPVAITNLDDAETTKPSPAGGQPESRPQRQFRTDPQSRSVKEAACAEIGSAEHGERFADRLRNVLVGLQ